jgi:hypothetical protein
MPRMSRSTGSSLICCTLKFEETSVVSATAGAEAVTVIASDTAENFMSTFA